MTVIVIAGFFFFISGTYRGSLEYPLTRKRKGLSFSGLSGILFRKFMGEGVFVSVARTEK